MKTIRAALAALILVLAGCGGGGGGGGASSPTAPASPTAPTSYRYTDYAPLNHESVTRDFLDGGVQHWCAEDNVVYWGGCLPFVTGERYAVVENPKDHRMWVFLLTYTSEVITITHTDGTTDQHRYEWPQHTTQATLVINGVPEDVTPPEAMLGQPYALLDAQGAYTLIVRGTSGESKQHCLDLYGPVCTEEFFATSPLTAGKRNWFWQETLTPQTAVVNSCWTGDFVNARDAIRQDEVWWDESSGWGRGSGNLVNGVPDGTGIKYSPIWQIIAKGAGYVWLGGGNRCLIR